VSMRPVSFECLPYVTQHLRGALKEFPRASKSAVAKATVCLTAWTKGVALTLPKPVLLPPTPIPEPEPEPEPEPSEEESSEPEQITFEDADSQTVTIVHPNKHIFQTLEEELANLNALLR
ncbi:hypothetical protein KIPB_016498, partial [Kipferlia bialata]